MPRRRKKAEPEKTAPPTLKRRRAMIDITVFVSYSRRDKHIVAPLVEFMTVFGQPFFRDEQSIPPGAQWKVSIAAAIQDCKSMLVFWCAHSKDSDEVLAEYQNAMALQKAIIPVLLDSTPLNVELSRYQAIDLRPALGDHRDDLAHAFGDLRPRPLLIGEFGLDSYSDHKKNGPSKRSSSFSPTVALSGFLLFAELYNRIVVSEYASPTQ